ncbi:ABC transporter ATP-binding protein [Ramlibacter sp. MMS24-I3-19]|uniref:ABC transporter ATP-binding protein n=1 Tax=Ramlibacter sp. MMS24-I3-19 TaxID=3416606 RepID=UPI003D04EE8D
MPSDVAVSVSHVTKTYRIFNHPADRIKQALTFGCVRFHKEFTALRNVSFEIERGATVGIIGRNGSGKSTLLQTIAGILTPTSGTVTVRGRVSALLELGAGFNLEFTGSENIYFQGALMGLTKQDIASRFDDIVAFADIGDFIDRPVRTYSSGMFVRLAFAVATSVDADVVLIDEALAVGDVAFQSRCFGRIQEMKKQGTTFLLVSHSTAQILNNADCALLLDGGSAVMYDRDVQKVVAAYEAKARNTLQAPTFPSQGAEGQEAAAGVRSREQLKTKALAETSHDLHESRFGTFEAIICKVVFVQEGSEGACLLPGRKTVARFHLEASRTFKDVALGVSIRLPGSADLWGDNNLLAECPLALHAGLNLVEFTFDFPMASGQYLVHVGLAAFESGSRVELDQRWPIEQITVVSDRTQLGHVFAPVTVTVVA